MTDELGPDVTIAAECRPGQGTRPEHGAEPELARGTVVGRYVVLSRLGAGAMGVVYAAYDPELDRKVALKLLRPGVARASSDAHGRLLREAQALAKLSHPNVVAVHDVGTRGDDVWVAMEFVEGQTLSDWLGQGRRRWTDVLSVMRPVAQGLSAAHDAGLVHRDIKPDNIMIDAARGDAGTRLGRVRVMDFGLARGFEPDDGSSVGGEAAAEYGHIEDAVTRVGAVAGTPAYMSPEQFAGRPTDARADQFSYCATFWEALYGERPFEGQTLAALAFNVLEGNRRAAPRGTRVPRWLRKAISRGLAVDPQARWPSLNALLGELERGGRRARMRKAAGALGLVALLGAGVWGQRQLDEERRIAACEAEGAAIEETWNEQVHAEVRAAIHATEAGHAATTAQRVMPWLDAYAEDWRKARTEACLDAHVRDAWDTKVLEQSVWCLDDRRLELDSLVSALRDPDVEAVTRAVTAAAELGEVQPCRDGVLLRRLPSPPKNHHGELRTVRADLARARALEATGAYDEGLEIARDSLARAEAIGWSPLTAAAQVQVGTLLAHTGALTQAQEVLESAYFRAAKAGAAETAHGAAASLAHVVGIQLQQHANGERWVKHARIVGSRLPDPMQLREARRLNFLGQIRRQTGAYDEAKQLHERALRISEEVWGEHPIVASMLNNLANVHMNTGDYDRARRLYERALGIRRKLLGDDHPDVGVSLNNLAALHEARAEYEEAAGLLGRALELQEHALGSTHPDVAQTISNLAAVQRGRGAYEEALRLQTRGLEIVQKSVGPEHPKVAMMLGNLALLRQSMGEHEEAARLHERVLRIRKKTLGPRHPDIATTLDNLASAYKAMGDYERAQPLYEQALQLRERALGPGHRRVGASLINLANLQKRMGHQDEAIESYQRALGILEKTLGPEHPDTAVGLYNLANLRTATGDYDAAIELHERALAIRKKTLRPHHPRLIKSLDALANALRKVGSLDEARTLYQRALSLREEALGADHPDVGYSLLGLADVALAQDHTAEAVSLAERALALCEDHDVPPDELAWARVVLARALVGAGRSKARALTLARQARDTLRGTEGARSDLLAQAQALLREHAPNR